MNTLQAFAMGSAARAQGAPMMVFDWDKAARLIKERQPREASAGLRSDWEWTGGVIYEDGMAVTDSYTFLASNWAVPELDLDGELVECFVMQADRPEFDSDTKWPGSALAILNGTVN